MQNFSFTVPTRVYFGRNILWESLNKEKSLLDNNVLIVTTGRSLNRLGYVKEITDSIKKISPSSSVTVFEEIDANPKVFQVEKAVKLGIQNKICTVIGFGGGSAIDAAKAVAVGIGGKKAIESYLFDGEIPPKETLPIIAIPTTAGTGTELSKGAILTCTKRKIKTGLRGDNICPKVAIVDSYFTEKIPESVTIDTGFDIFAHAIESYVSKKSNLFSEMLSLEAIRIVAKNLPLLKNDLSNTEARKSMSYASMIMGINLAFVGTVLPHRMQYPIGARTDTSHGQGLMALYPSWLKYEYRYSKEKIDSVSMVISDVTKTNERDSVFTIINFIEKLGNRHTLANLGIKLDELDILNQDITGNIANDPASQEKDIINKIYKESF